MESVYLSLLLLILVVAVAAVERVIGISVAFKLVGFLAPIGQLLKFSLYEFEVFGTNFRPVVEMQLSIYPNGFGFIGNEILALERRNNVFARDVYFHVKTSKNWKPVHLKSCAYALRSDNVIPAFGCPGWPSLRNPNIQDA